jgi:cellobiose phosphorylase
MYRLGIEAILDITRPADSLQINACNPKDWSGFKLTYRFSKASYQVYVKNQDGINWNIRQIILDGVPPPDKRIRLKDDGWQHDIRVMMGITLCIDK